MPTYLRFVVADIDEDSGKELGVFQAVFRLQEEGKLNEHEEKLHDATRQWFNENLEKPTRFTASKPPFYRKRNKAIVRTSVVNVRALPDARQSTVLSTSFFCRCAHPIQR
jgi:hypothetical protein